MIRFPHIRVVDASAGSGKTQQLALRAINLIFARGIKEILAITFTNDATREMRQRIFDMLKKAALEDKDSEGDERIIDEILREKIDDNLSAQDVKKKAALTIDTILGNYLDFRVSTIDSFVNRVCSASALEIGFPPRYEVVMDARPYIEYAVDYLISGIGSRGDVKEFNRFINSYLVMEDQKSWNPRQIIFDNVKELLEKEGIRGLDFEISKHDFKDGAEFIKARESVVRILSDKELVRLNAECAKTNVTSEKKSIEKLIEKIKEAIDAKDFEKLGGHTDGLSPETREALSSFYCRLSSSRYSEYIKMFEKVKKELEDIRHKESIVFINELNTEVKKFITEKSMVPQIYCMLGETIRHYLIDEFQDTSNLQWQNFYPLIENGLSEGGSLFYVGDRKQAIFRFRGGDPRLFTGARESFEKIVEDSSESSLKNNYRSRKEIVDVNNVFFSKQNLQKILANKNPEFENGWIYKPEDEWTYRDASQEVARENSKGGIIRVVKFKASNKEELYNELKSVVLPPLRKALKTHKHEDVAFLVMTNEETEMLTVWLSEQGFQVESQVTMDIRKNRTTQEIISFLKFLNSPLDNFSLSSFLAGEIFGKANGLTREESYARLKALKGERVYYTKFRERYPLEWKTCFEHFFKKAGFLPPYDLVSEFLKVYRVMENFSGSQSFVMKLLEFINYLEKRGENSLAALLDYWVSSDEDDDSFQVVLPSCPEAIKVKTIFKAKGLGFPVVFMVFLPHTQRENNFVVEEDNRMTIKYITKEYAGFCNKLKKEYDAEMEKQFFDQLNELYVGMTRAKDELHAFICETREKNEFMNLVEGEPATVKSVQVQEPLGKYRKKKVEKETQGAQAQEIKDTPGWGMRISRRISGTEMFKESGIMERKKRGEFIHAVLSSIDAVHGNFSDFIDGILSVSAKRQRYAGNLQEISGAILNLFKDERVQRWFSLKGGNEKSIISGKGEVFRMDRIVFSENLVEVIDFKSGEEYQDKHRDQVKNYINLVSEIYPGKNIMGYIVYIEENRVVEVNG